MSKISIRFFDNKEVRSVWDEENSKWWFSVIDIVGILSESSDARNYWYVLKNRLKKSNSEVLTNCKGLKLTAPDGKLRLTDTLDDKGIVSLAKEFPGRKANKFIKYNILKENIEIKNKGVQYEFSAKVWYLSSDGMCGWYFISLPKELAKTIRDNLKFLEEGWGRMKITAKIGNSEWRTAIWFDTKQDTYLLPLKAEIRKKEKIEIDNEVETIIWI